MWVDITDTSGATLFAQSFATSTTVSSGTTTDITFEFSIDRGAAYATWDSSVVTVAVSPPGGQLALALRSPSTRSHVTSRSPDPVVHRSGAEAGESGSKHRYPDSTSQDESHPSLETVFLSSHSSVGPTTPFPQLWHIEGSPSHS